MKTKRNTLKLLSGASAIALLAPQSWVKPAIKSIVLPAHAQTSMNQAPVGESFTIDAFGDSALAIDLTVRASDPDGDPVTISIVNSGVLDGALEINEAVVDGLVIRLRVRNGSGDVFVDYNVSDGMATSPTYRVTVTNLDGPFS